MGVGFQYGEALDMDGILLAADKASVKMAFSGPRSIGLTRDCISASSIRVQTTGKLTGAVHARPG